MSKFSEMQQQDGGRGFKFVKNGIMVGKNKFNCIQCQEPTEFIEICTEAHFCSDECVDNWYTENM